MDALPSSSSVAKTPALVSTSTSGSIHNRLVVSSSSSARRLRAQSVAESDGEKLVNEAKITKSFSTVQSSPSLPLYDSLKTPSERQPIFYWIILSYGVLCMVFLTSRLLGISLQPHANNPSFSPAQSVSAINEFSISYRLSKILSFKPEVEAFWPFLSGSAAGLDVSDVTACLWATEEEIHHLGNWVDQWGGPISVVILTNSTLDVFIGRLKEPEQTLISMENLTTHVIQKAPVVTNPSSSYLNIARMFARTRYVLLSPSPTLRLPGTSYEQIISKLASGVRVMKHPYVLVPEKVTQHPTFPSNSSPLLLEQSHPIWCSERFFSSSREEDWEDCLWQFWLHSHGTLRRYPVSGWKSSVSRKAISPTESRSVDKLIHQRLSYRSRHEACVLAAKRLKDKAEGGKLDSRKVQWLRKTCRPIMNNWNKDDA